jgi:malate synthase
MQNKASLTQQTGIIIRSDQYTSLNQNQYTSNQISTPSHHKSTTMEARSPTVQIEVHAPICAAASEILTPDSLRFVGYLCNKFEDRRQALLNARKSKAMEFDSGGLPHFEKSDGSGSGGVGSGIREPHSHGTEDPHWRCASIPGDVMDRRVEITGLVNMYRIAMLLILCF